MDKLGLIDKLLLGGAMAVAVVGACYLGSLDIPNRASAALDGKSYEDFKKGMREGCIERKIEDVWKYDSDKNEVIDANEYRKLLEDEWDDDPRNN